MKLAVVGATGGIGRLLCTQAGAAGHHVTAVVRDPAARPAAAATAVVDLARPGATAELVAAVEGAGAVLSALGPRSAAEIGVVAAGTRRIVAAMHVAGTTRLVVVSAAPVGAVASRRPDPGDGIVMRTLLAPVVRRVFRDGYADLAAMEAVLRASGLDWTAVRPPRLTDGPRTGTYRTALDRNVRRGLVIGRADVADAMLAAATDPATIGHTIGLAR